MRRSETTRGFTLVEILVVLILMGLAAGIVAPALLPPLSGGLDLGRLTHRTQEIAARRAETLRLGIDATGAWRITAVSGEPGDPLAAGRLDSYAGPAARVVVSPLGTCGFDQTSAAAARSFSLDPLTCELIEP